MTSPARPWWQMTKTPKGGFLLGGFWTFMAVFRWLDVALGDGNNWGGRSSSVALAVMFTVAAGFLLTTAFLLRRRQERAGRPV